MKTQINIEAFNQSLERGKNVVITPAKVYVSKQEQVRKLNVSAFAISIERGSKSC